MLGVFGREFISACDGRFLEPTDEHAAKAMKLVLVDIPVKQIIKTLMKPPYNLTYNDAWKVGRAAAAVEAEQLAQAEADADALRLRIKADLAGAELAIRDDRLPEHLTDEALQAKLDKKLRD